MNEKTEEMQSRIDNLSAQVAGIKRKGWMVRGLIYLVIGLIVGTGAGILIVGNGKVGLVDVAPGTLEIPEGWVDIQDIICIHYQDSTYVVGMIDSTGQRMIDGIAVLSFVLERAEDEGVREAIALLEPFGPRTVQIREGPPDAP